MSITSVTSVCVEKETQYNEHPDANSNAYLKWFDLVPALEDRVVFASATVSSRVISHKANGGKILIDKEIQCLLPPAIPQKIMAEMECIEQNNQEKATWVAHEEIETVNLGEDDAAANSEWMTEEDVELSEDSDEDTLEAEQLSFSSN